IVTNNILVEQQLKLRSCAMDSLIDELVTSEEVGATKPDVRIFETALARLGIGAEDAVMIGDAWLTDIAGAKAAGIRRVWFKRRGAPNPDPEVAELRAFEPLDHALRAITQ